MVDLPAGAIDAHCHVFGPAAVFPFAPERTFTPPDVPLAALQAKHAQLGLARAVIVQSACHGHDHAALLDALGRFPDRYRGVALIRPDTPAAEIAALDAAGVCGFRLNFMPHLGADPAEADVRAMVDLTPGWHVSVHVAGDGIRDYAELIASLPGPVVIDHMARVDPASDAVDALLALLDTGRVWVKLSAADRISDPPYAEGAALAARLFAHAPERCVWGTDFPHPNHQEPIPDDGALVGLLATIAPSAPDRERLLVTNPAALFGF
jgi:2-pyrone-4,6-dicarboxylate lactonase